MGNVRYVTIMSELSPGHLTAELHFPSPPRLPVGTLEFSELWKDGQVDAAVHIGSWQVDLEAVAEATRTPAKVLDVTALARPDLTDLPPPIASGYQISVMGSNDLLFSRLVIEVELIRHQFGITLGRTEEQKAILTATDNHSLTATLIVPRPRRALTTRLYLHDVQLADSLEVWSALADFPVRLRPKHAQFGTNEMIFNESQFGLYLVGHTSGTVDGESITVTVLARRIADGE